MRRTILCALLAGGAGAIYAGCSGKEVPLIQNTGDAAAEGGGAIGGDAGDAGDAGGPALRWYETCGDPVCPTPSDSGAADAGACAAAGTSCGPKGATCGDPAQNCGVVLVCDDHDPRTGGCPLSSKKYKQDITYADQATLERLHDETLAMRLATYRYSGKFLDPNDPHAEHLGFIIEDQPESFSVDRGHDRVDLYGTMSMAIATMQVQEREIAELRSEIASLRSACGPGDRKGTPPR